MRDDNQALVLDLVEFVAKQPRAYADVMEAWRTSCPRLTIWEDALDEHLVHRFRDAGGVSMVAATDDGRRLLESMGRL